VVRYKQYFLFSTVKIGESTLSIVHDPFPHIEVVKGETRIMFPVKYLRDAKRLIEGLTPSERAIIKKMMLTASKD